MRVVMDIPFFYAQGDEEIGGKGGGYDESNGNDDGVNG